MNFRNYIIYLMSINSLFFVVNLMSMEERSGQRGRPNEWAFSVPEYSDLDEQAADMEIEKAFAPKRQPVSSRWSVATASDSGEDQEEQKLKGVIISSAKIGEGKGESFVKPRKTEQANAAGQKLESVEESPDETESESQWRGDTPDPSKVAAPLGLDLSEASGMVLPSAAPVARSVYIGDFLKFRKFIDDFKRTALTSPILPEKFRAIQAFYQILRGHSESDKLYADFIEFIRNNELVLNRLKRFRINVDF